ncbi:hypothetical protein BKA67DRAFT_648333 [Truncatella angustata]|uniref:Uncharacterized protein n=1 Tax=Truncatella angustata TaxID=152316 RepID=A0A9P8UE52_9PEZI|nr:uncharacterized protein BKA67DRAFT_648333 [Truncatella angustata]KAH6648265.1 hypothetical protein BKA67DRAFT_648333 [Truncatella angustata]
MKQLRSRVTKRMTVKRRLHYKKFSHKNTLPIVALLGGCSIELNQIGLPHWLVADAVIFQLNLERAFMVTSRLIELCGLTGYTSDVEEDILEWNAGSAGLSAERRNPLFCILPHVPASYRGSPWFSFPTHLDYDQTHVSFRIRSATGHTIDSHRTE